MGVVMLPTHRRTSTAQGSPNVPSYGGHLAQMDRNCMVLNQRRDKSTINVSNNNIRISDFYEFCVGLSLCGFRAI
jgi:hypothetical protein